MRFRCHGRGALAWPPTTIIIGQEDQPHPANRAKGQRRPHLPGAANSSIARPCCFNYPSNHYQLRQLHRSSQGFPRLGLRRTSIFGCHPSLGIRAPPPAVVVPPPPPPLPCRRRRPPPPRRRRRRRLPPPLLLPACRPPPPPPPPPAAGRVRAA